jgi:hypothetical protein
MSCQKNYRKTRSTQKKFSGGTSTGDFMISKVGGPGEQVRGPDGSILVKAGSAQAMAIKPMMGGGKKGGKGMLTNIAVPAVLLYANTMTKSMGKSKKYSKSRKYRNKSRKYRK